MSTIKSSDEHLTLNADGSSKDIKFQANGVEKASISSSGAFTSTTIDATKLTGNLPAISGANLTGVGVAGISSSADGTAITIDSNERVTVNSGELVVSNNASWGGEVAGKIEQLNNTLYIQGGSGSTSHIFRNSSGTNILDLTDGGRGLSQFTAKAWANWNGKNTPAFRDSHNCSSLTDVSTGNYRINFSNNMANANYCAVSSGNADQTWQGAGTHPSQFYTSYVHIYHTENNGGVDTDYNTVLVFGD